MLVLSPSFVIDHTLLPKLKVKFKMAPFNVLHVSVRFYGTNRTLKIKELLVLQFDH